MNNPSVHCEYEGSHPRSGHIFKDSTSWWLNQPIWKIWSSNWIISPGFGVKIKTYLKPPPSSIMRRDSQTKKTNDVEKRKHQIRYQRSSPQSCMIYILYIEIKRNQVSRLCNFGNPFCWEKNKITNHLSSSLGLDTPQPCHRTACDLSSGMNTTRHKIHAWYMLNSQLASIHAIHVGKYSIHGSYGHQLKGSWVETFRFANLS